jgi:hypothetical protein
VAEGCQRLLKEVGAARKGGGALLCSARRGRGSGCGVGWRGLHAVDRQQLPDRSGDGRAMTCVT